MEHIEVLFPHPEPVVVVMGPRLRCTAQDRDLTEYMLSEILVHLNRPVTFRVSGMITGPEMFVEDAAPRWGHRVEVWGSADTDRARRTNRNDDIERDAGSLLGAHALWVWTLTSELNANSRLLDYEMLIVAKDLGVPVFLVTPDSHDYRIAEL